MKTYFAYVMILICSLFSEAKAQNIRPADLNGEWTMDWGKTTLYLNFVNDSTYKYIIDNDTSTSIDFYKLLVNKEEFVLELYMNSGTYAGSVKSFLIRKINNVSYKLQNPQRNQLGEILSYKWQKINKTNTFYLYRQERRQAITN